MENEFQIGGYKILGGKICIPVDTPIWTNPVPHPYSRRHLTEGELKHPDPYKFADPAVLDKVLRSNAIDTVALQPEKFPLISDFEVVLIAGIKGFSWCEDDLYYRTAFWTESRGVLVETESSFPELYAPDRLRQKDFRIPCGDFATPYYDFGQGFMLLIAEHDGFVYIMQGDYDELDTVGYDVWFKVTRACYFSQWERAMQSCRDYCK